MHKATKFMAALVLSLGLAACGGGAAASSAASTADTTSATSTADTTSAASATSTTTTTTTTTADYVNDSLGFTYTMPAGMTRTEGSAYAFECSDEKGASFNINVINETLDLNDSATMDALKTELTKQLESIGFTIDDVQIGTYELSLGTYPSIACTASMNGTSMSLVQVYITGTNQIVAISAGGIDGSTSIKTMMDGFAAL